jgi:hypothetical protein
MQSQRDIRDKRIAIVDRSGAIAEAAWSKRPSAARA